MSRSVSPRAARPVAAVVVQSSKRAADRSGRARGAPSQPSIAAVALAGEVRSIPLSSLVLSAHNVRRAPAGGIEELAALIRSQGLLQPLCVTPLADGTRPRFAVEAGGRRLRALQWLAERGEITPDAPVECKLFDASRSHEVSLAENSARQAMHPADQCAAFRALIDAGRTPEEVALRFGVSAQTVQRRLRLAGIAPELIERFRAGEASLEQMQALAITDDPARQLAVWNGSDTWSRQPWQLRRRLLGDEVPADDPRVRFVGLGTYEAAGGQLRQDLFSERDEAFLTDPVLLDRLVAQRLHEEADTVCAEGWAWCEPRLAFDHAERARFVRIEPPRRPLDDTEARELQALQAERDEVARQVEALEQADDCDEDELTALEARSDRIEARLRELHSGSCEWTAEDRARAGAVVALERGTLVVIRGLVRREDCAPEAAGAAGEGAGAEPAASVRPDHSERLMFALTSHLTAAMQASLVAAPRIALAVLAHRLVLDLRRPYHASPVKVDARSSRATLERQAPDIGASRAGETMARARDRWGEALPNEPVALLAWLLAQPCEVLVELLAFCTAETLDATHGSAGRRDEVTDAIRTALELEMADWWEPTAATYLDAVPKARIVAAVTEACGAQAATDLAAMKKADAVKAAQTRLAGTRWLPAPLRRPAMSGSVAAE